jgi:hypothetical protein
MMNQQERLNRFQAQLQARTAVKAIAGIANLEIDRIEQVVRAANEAGVVAVDVAAARPVVEHVRAMTDAVLFASSIHPAELAEAVEAGADAVELGNYDALYDQGLFLSAEDVLKLAQETVSRVAGRAFVCVTVPGHLGVDAQIRLARELEALGVNLIQTEGAARLLAAEPKVQTLSAAEKATLTLSNTRALVAATRLPVMSASGIAAVNVADAIEAGASAVGIGSAINRLATVDAMTQELVAIQSAVSAVAPVVLEKVS